LRTPLTALRTFAGERAAFSYGPVGIANDSRVGPLTSALVGPWRECDLQDPIALVREEFVCRLDPVKPGAMQDKRLQIAAMRSLA
jgi:hypothetical protein